MMNKTLPTLLILALFVVGCADSSELKTSITTYKVKVSGVCSDLQNTYESSYDIAFYFDADDSDFFFMDVQDNTTIDLDSEDYWNETEERLSLVKETFFETIDVAMEYESPKVHFTEMTQEIFEKDNWNIKSIHRYESLGLDDDDYFYVKGSCQLKVLERDTFDGSFLNNRELHI